MVKTRRQKLCLVLALGFLAFALAGLQTCTRNRQPYASANSGTGDIAPVFLFKRQSPAIEIPSQVITVQITVQGADFDTTARFPYSLRRAEIRDIPVGLVNFTIEGLDGKNETIYRADTTVTVIKDAGVKPVVTLKSTKPVVLICTSPQNGDSVGNATVTLSGFVSAQNGLLTLQMNDANMSVSGDQWSKSVTLAQGKNSFAFLAADRAGNILNDTLVVHYTPGLVDNSGPIITITQIKNGDKISVSPLLLAGTVSDGTGVLSLTVNGRNAVIAGNAWSAPVNLVPGGNPISIVATDNSAQQNKTTRTLSVVYDSTTVDNIHPFLSLDEPKDGDTIPIPSVVVKGTASDLNNILSVMVNNEQAILTGNHWNREISLVYGPNPVTVIATDNSVQQNKTTKLITVIYDSTAADKTPPSIDITSPDNNTKVPNPKGVSVSGTASDFSGIQSVSVNGIAATVNGEDWTASIDLAAYGNNLIKAVATDGKGLKDSTAVSIVYDTTVADVTPPTIGLASHTSGQKVATARPLIQLQVTDDQSDIAWVKVDGNPTTLNSGKYEFSPVMKLGPNSFTAIAQDNSTNKNTDTLFFSLVYDPTISDATPPTITLSSHKNGDTIHTSPATVKATVTDSENDILSVTINGQPATLVSGKYERAVTLNVGSNPIVVIAKDKSANQNSATTSLNLVYLAPGLMAYYPFNDSANDESGNGNHGTVNGATPTADRFGNASSAYYFDGMNDLIIINNSASLNLANRLTMAAWIKTNGLPSGQDESRIICKGRGGHVVSSYVLEIVNYSGYAAAKTCVDNGGGRKELAATTLTNGTWHFLVATWNSTSLSIYIDGKLSGAKSYSSEMNTNTNGLAIGGREDEVEDWFKGTIDDIRIYNYALSASQIDSLYHLGGWPLTPDFPYGVSIDLSMPFPLREPVVTEYAVSGNVFVMGGDSGGPGHKGEYCTKVYTYNVVTGTWRNKGATLPYGTIRNDCALIGDYIYILPGLGPKDNNGWGQHTHLMRYNHSTDGPISNHHQFGGSMVWGGTATPYNDSIIYLHGIIDYPIEGSYKYNTRQNTATHLSTAPAYHSYLTVKKGPVFYCFGGISRSGRADHVWKHSPDDSFEQLACDEPEDGDKFRSSAAWLSGDSIFICYKDSTYCFDTVIENFVESPQLGHYVYFSTVSYGTGDGKIYIFGGIDEAGNTLNRLLVLTPK